MKMKTFMAKKEGIEHAWYCIDAAEHILGRLAARVATILQGKHKPTYTPHVDTGDFVVVVNADKIGVTGKKLAQKEYRYFTGYPSGLRSRTLEDLLEKRPEKVIRLAVRRMLPKSKLGDSMFRKLKVYAGPDHPHAAQQPSTLSL